LRQLYRYNNTSQTLEREEKKCAINTAKNMIKKLKHNIIYIYIYIYISYSGYLINYKYFNSLN